MDRGAGRGEHVQAHLEPVEEGALALGPVSEHALPLLDLRHVPERVGEDEEAGVARRAGGRDGDEHLAVGRRLGVGRAEEHVVEGAGERRAAGGADVPVEREVAGVGDVHDLHLGEVRREVEREEPVVVEEDVAADEPLPAGLVREEDVPEVEPLAVHAHAPLRPDLEPEVGDADEPVEHLEVGVEEGDAGGAGDAAGAGGVPTRVGEDRREEPVEDEEVEPGDVEREVEGAGVSRAVVAAAGEADGAGGAEVVPDGDGVRREAEVHGDSVGAGHVPARERDLARAPPREREPLDPGLANHDRLPERRRHAELGVEPPAEEVAEPDEREHLVEVERGGLDEEAVGGAGGERAAEGEARRHRRGVVLALDGEPVQPDSIGVEVHGLRPRRRPRLPGRHDVERADREAIDAGPECEAGVECEPPGLAQPLALHVEVERAAPEADVGRRVREGADGEPERVRREREVERASADEVWPVAAPEPEGARERAAPHAGRLERVASRHEVEHE